MDGFDAMKDAVIWPTGTKAVLLVDLDAFFASVEQLDHPEYRGKPVIVGGDADKHGVVSTCSYEARTYGVRSAMPASQAKRLCPDGIFVHGNYPRYQEMSAAVMDILRQETPLVQQVSIDEAFVDVTPTRINTENPVSIAMRIQQNVAKLGITCSIGVGTSKAVAKIASDIDKPKGLTVVAPGTEKDFLAGLPVRAMSGVGKATERKLLERGITTLGQVADTDIEDMKRLLGKTGVTLWMRANGLDEGPLQLETTAKSISSETTFADPLDTRESLMASILSMGGIVGRRARKAGVFGRTLSLKVRYLNRETSSMQVSLESATDDPLAHADALGDMLDALWTPGLSVSLVGVSLSQFERSGALAGHAFDEHGTSEHDAKHRRLAEATDSVKDKFGETAVLYGHDLHNSDNTTGSIAKNSRVNRPDYSQR